MMIRLILLLTMTCIFVSANGADHDETSGVNFAREVLPIISNKCFVCHGPDADEDMLRLDSFAAATQDRGGYHAILPTASSDSSASASELLKRIHSDDDPMPPADAEQQLTDAERDVLTRWVKQGGQYDLHWAFVPPVKAHPLAEADANGSQIIDAFIAQGFHPQGTEFAATADRHVLARRAALTLTGLPPEPAALQSFVADESEDAFSRYVDALLESEKYGEHQARFWLDAVRYGDTHGLHLDNRRGIYPYRDWVIFALNRNLPLNDFITWQLAGDLLPDPTLEQRVATGFVRMNPSTSEGGVIADEFQAKNNFDRTETLGTVFLGMTFTCARCHTHKYDPILHDEYYRLFAFFNNTQESPLDGNKYDYAPTIRAPQDLDAWHHWAAGTKPPDELEKNFTTTLVAAELDQPRVTRVLARGEYDQPIGAPLQPDVPAAFGSFPSEAPRNRLGLAQWLTSRENPLVARVLMNRLWQQIFGHALVRTPEDFGLQGQQPTHPELLDWLAVELQDSDWNLKHMLRLMLLSRTFQQSSAWRMNVDDPENRLFARGPSYRLDAEVLRDMGLWASGLLDPKMGGEGVKPYQPDGMWLALAHPASNTKKYEPDSGQRLYRRSIYVYWKRTSPHPMMTLFDAPSRESSCVRRSRTNTSLQSLGLLNETQRVEMSRKLAERLLTQSQTDAERLDMLFNLLVCRTPAGQERATAERLLTTMRERFQKSPADAAALLATGESASSDKLNQADLAAWTQVAATVLASDLSIMLY